jgi:hypothetical protein
MRRPLGSMPQSLRSRLVPAAVAAALAGLTLAVPARAQAIPAFESLPLPPLCRTVVTDASGVIRLEIVTGHPAPNGLTFHVAAWNSDGGAGTVTVADARGESAFGGSDWDSGAPYRLHGSVRPRETGVHCYVVTYDVTVHVPAGGYRRLVGRTTVKTAKPEALE